MLLELPVEILHLILKEVPRRADLKHLSETSKRLCEITIPYLYESVDATCDDDVLLGAGWDWRWNEFAGRLCRNRSRLRFIRDLSIKPPLSAEHYSSCLSNDFRKELSESDEEHPRFPGLSKTFLEALSGFEKNQLRKFSWELGTCIPESLWSENGYLPLYQNQIESLVLVTAAHCSQRSALDLSAFKNLKRLSWRGYSSSNDTNQICDTLNQNGSQLIELEFHPIRSPYQADIWSIDLTASILSQIDTPLSALETLSLFQVQIHQSRREGDPKLGATIKEKLAFEKLHSLNLWACRGSGYFLNLMSSSTIRLSSLSILHPSEDRDWLFSDSFDSPDPALDLVIVLPRFLQSFTGLRNLFIAISGPIRSKKLMDAIKVHSKSLRWFSFHQNPGDLEVIRLDDAAQLFESGDENNTLDGLMVPVRGGKGFGVLNEAYCNDLLEDFDLQFLGLRCHPSKLISLLKPFARKRCLQALHIRLERDDQLVPGPKARDEEEEYLYGSNPLGSTPLAGSWTKEDNMLARQLREIATWAFGPTGIPSLELIGCGDFYRNQLGSDTVYILRGPHVSASTGAEPPTRSKVEVLESNHLFSAFRFQRTEEHPLLEHFAYALKSCPKEALETYGVTRFDLFG